MKKRRISKMFLLLKPFPGFDDFDEQHLGSIDDPLRFDLRL